MPDDPARLLQFVTPQLDGVAKQTLFQTLLPASVQVDEAREPWLKSPSTVAILSRLRSGKPVKIEPALLDPFGV
jgi:hypothetical protein